MADAKKVQEGGKESPMGFVIGLAVVTVIAGGGGFVFATQFLKSEASARVSPRAEIEKAEEKKESSHGETSEHKEVEAEVELDIIPLTPIITNLSLPAGTYVRLEGNLLVEKDAGDTKVLAAKVSEDIIALLRSMSLSEIQGANGLAHLRDDINDRVRVRSEGKARELIISTLVME